ncbi:MAG: WD40-repeat-containing domain protein [Benniella sp.]|nr:MAG: WD40-repeat-containing domain protein [Benniella sp.]
MIFGIVTPSLRGNLSLQQSLELANAYLECAGKVHDRGVALVMCYDTEVSLLYAKKDAKHANNRTVRHGIANAYIKLARVLEGQGCGSEARAIYKKAEKLGVNVQDQFQVAQTLAFRSDIASTKGTVSSTTNSAVDTLPFYRPLTPVLRKHNRINDVATIPSHIFAENVRPITPVVRLPEPDERLHNTPQLACCLGLLKKSRDLDDILEPVARNWLQVVGNDEDEQERLKILALDVIRTFKKEEIKDAKAIAEVVCLAPVIDKDIFRDLLGTFCDEIDRFTWFEIHQLQGLARLIQDADTGYLDADDLVKILRLFSKRLRDSHQQSPQHMYQLTLAASYVLDALADIKVEGLDRETLHEQMSMYLDALKSNAEPYLIYQAAYACQALLCVPDNESLWQATIRRSGKVIQGVSGLVSVVRGLDLNGFIDGLKDIQQGLAGASEVLQVVVNTFDGVNSLSTSGRGFLDALKEGFSFKRKCAWYAALRGADALIRDGEFASFKKLVCEAPCRLDPAFQWGVCQRLGGIACNPAWDLRTRRNAAGFLGEMYQNDEDWGRQASVKEWIVIILMQVSSSAGGVRQYVEILLQELESNADSESKAIFQSCREKDPSSYPLKIALPSLASPSILDRVQNKLDVEGRLRQLRKRRLKGRGNDVYIQPQAKARLQASDDQRFPLMEKVDEFLSSNDNVFLLLGDSGAGKSTFYRQLECDLWSKYMRTTGRIPLFISLPDIDKPEQDMTAKQLRKAGFTELEIRELKMHRKFILICDGYDESQQTNNLYISNRLNQPRGWNAQMLISCRSDYLGVYYRDRFQPGDRNQRSEYAHFQEAVITPFTPDQVRDFIKQYVSLHQPLWEARDYEQALDLIPSLKEFVRNPFLMTLSLEVLPRMVDPGEYLSATQVTRVALYDQFIEHWLERGKKRLNEKELSPQAKAAFESLVDEGFTRNGIDFLKKLATAIYKEQGGQPIVSYSRFKDEGSWKAEFFSRNDEKQLLREACPLTRSGNQHRFIHRSLLDYGMALAIFDPYDWKERPLTATVSGRRGSTSSTFSFRIRGSKNEVATPSEQGPDVSSPLAWRYFINDPTVLEFLCERVQQQPVFKQQLLDYIEHSKMDARWRIAAANAITILVRAGIQFNGADLRGIRIPGADLSFGGFEAAQLQDADLRQVTLRSAWLRQADLSRAQMTAVQFGELPFLKEDSQVMTCAYSPDGEALALGLDSGEIKVYSTSSWEHIQMLTGHCGYVWRVVYSWRGGQMASCGKDGLARLWDAQSGRCIHTLSGHSGALYGAAFSPHGDAVATGGNDTTVRVWDVGTGECRLILIGHSAIVWGVVYSPSGTLIASGSEDSTVRLWDVMTGMCLSTLSGHNRPIWDISYSPRGERLASSHGDGAVRIWDVETGTCCRVLTGHSEGVATVAYSTQGDAIASAGHDNTARIWDAETGTCRQVLTGHSSTVRCVVFSSRGDHIACCSEDKTVRLWDVGSGGTRQFATGHRNGVLSVRYSPRGDQIVSSSSDGSINLWDAETGASSCVLAGHRRSVRSIAYSPRGDLVASGSGDGTVKLWDVETGLCRQTFTGHTGFILVVEYSPWGRQIASGDDSGTLKLWDAWTGVCEHTLIGHTGYVRSTMYSPYGNQIASSGWDKTVRIWNAEDGACLHILCGHDAEVRGIAYSPQGDLLASVSADSTMRLWDVESGECRQTSVGHTASVVVVVYSPQGSQVATGSEDGTVRVWDKGTGECLHTFTGHTSVVSSVVYSSTGDQIVSGSEDATVCLWDVTSGQCLAEIDNINSPIRSIAWSTILGVKCFVVGYDDGSVRMWEVVGAGDRCRVRLRWRPVKGELDLTDTLIQDVHGLSRYNRQLLWKRGTIGEPLDRLREVSKKVTQMVSVVSTLNQRSTGVVPESSIGNLADPGQPEHPLE